MGELTKTVKGLETNRFSPANMSEAMKFAELLANADMLPKNLRGKPSDVLYVCLLGSDLGMTFTQSITGIYVVNGRAALATDAMIALIMRSGKAKYFKCVETSDESATYETHRDEAGYDARQQTYTIEQARKAGRLDKDSPWRTDPADMLRRRAASKLAREVYPDVIGGYVTPEEAHEIDGVSPGAKISPRIAAEPVQQLEADDDIDEVAVSWAVEAMEDEL